MRVSVQRGLHLLMAQPVSDGQRGEAQLDQQTGMTVPDIVQADTLHFSVSGPPDHLMLKKGFGAGEYAVVLMEPVEPPCIGFQLVPQKLRYRLPCGYSSVSWEASQRPCRLCADRIC